MHSCHKAEGYVEQYKEKRPDLRINFFPITDYDVSKTRLGLGVTLIKTRPLRILDGCV
jgi:hypothetical protein